MSDGATQNQYGQRMGAKGRRTRERLLDATADLMEARAVRDLKVTEIAARAGAATSTFYLYFDDVVEAVLAVTERLEQYTPELEDLLQEDWTTRTAIAKARAVVTAYVDFWDQHHAILRYRNLAAEEGDARFREARHRSTARILDLVRGKVAAAGPPVDPTAAATAVMTLMERIPAISRTPEPRRRSRSALIDAAAFTLAILATPDASRLEPDGPAA